MSSSAAAVIVPNGQVGDWRLDDDEFLATFRLPGLADKLPTLERQNPLVRDRRIVFEEEHHVYFIDGDRRAPRSVTQLVHHVSNEFDGAAAVVAMRRGRNWAKNRPNYLRADGTEMSDEEIVAKWAKNGKVQSSRGTLMHYQIEQFLNGAEIEKPWSPEFAYFMRFKEDFMDERCIRPLRTELSLFHCGLRVAGQADLIAVEEGGGVVILDWKRSKKIEYRNAYRKLKAPLSHLDDCNYNLYSLQLNVYRYILESEYGMRVTGMFLGVFHPNEPAPICVAIPRLDREISLLVEHEKSEGRAGDPVPGEDAPFC